MTNTEVRELTTDEPSTVLRTAADGRLHVHVDGRCVPVRLRQCFPWSEPGLHLSLRDDEDREVAIVDDPADARRRVAARARAGARRGGVRARGDPRAGYRRRSRDPAVDGRDTSRGRGRSRRTSTIGRATLPNGGLLIRDVAGDLYRLAAPESMDKKSRELFWAFVD